MDKQAIKNSFKGMLPRGFTSTIQQRLKDRGISKSAPMISKVCNPDTANWNTDIIAEALKLANEESAKLTTLKKQADKL